MARSFEKNAEIASAFVLYGPLACSSFPCIPSPYFSSLSLSHFLLHHERAAMSARRHLPAHGMHGWIMEVISHLSAFIECFSGNLLGWEWGRPSCITCISHPSIHQEDLSFSFSFLPSPTLQETSINGTERYPLHFSQGSRFSVEFLVVRCEFSVSATVGHICGISCNYVTIEDFHMDPFSKTGLQKFLFGFKVSIAVFRSGPLRRFIF